MPTATLAVLWQGDRGTLSCGAARCRDRSRSDRHWSLLTGSDLAELGALLAATGHWELACQCGQVYYDTAARTLRDR